MLHDFSGHLTHKEQFGHPSSIITVLGAASAKTQNEYVRMVLHTSAKFDCNLSKQLQSIM